MINLKIWRLVDYKVDWNTYNVRCGDTSVLINCIDQNNCDRRYDTNVKISNDGGEWRDKLLQWTRKKRLRERGNDKVIHDDRYDTEMIISNSDDWNLERDINKIRVWWCDVRLHCWNSYYISDALYNIVKWIANSNFWNVHEI